MSFAVGHLPGGAGRRAALPSVSLSMAKHEIIQISNLLERVPASYTVIRDNIESLVIRSRGLLFSSVEAILQGMLRWRTIQ